ncbi:MAG: right-handed parallel beta-helix repeat-containing protein, partial [Acidobacteriaceae bacterium]|nr:right-handed parallel beta-helix repeat-containing protein [Acidobacteriaceae bacterium]
SANIGHDVASGNVIHHGGVDLSAASHCELYQGIYFGDPYDVITNNVISGLIGWGVQIYGGGVCHQVISNNTIFNNSQGGLRIENVTGVGGHWDECGNGGIADYMTVTNNIIVNNGMGKTYTGTGAGIDATGYGTGGTHNLYSHNIVFGNEPASVLLSGPDVSADEKIGTVFSVFVNFQADTNWAPATPYNYLNYALAAGSPAIAAGTSACAAGTPSCVPATDVTGASRLMGVYDIGAFAFLQSAILRLPARTNVI